MVGFAKEKLSERKGGGVNESSEVGLLALLYSKRVKNGPIMSMKRNKILFTYPTLFTTCNSRY
jgi:hypothetical protein